jgi:hypothetical protein
MLMSMHANILLAAAAVLASTAFAASKGDDPPVYFEGGQYSAALQQGAQRWHLQPIQGDDVEVTDRACASATRIPNGVWIVTHDESGQAQLLAPSTIVLPPGYPERLQLRVCGDGAAQDSALWVPAIVLDWIKDQVGAVLIDD